MENIKSLPIRPYARLLTMLGEQLIKNERIALIELIKNSYDADAEWVKITFENFGENYEIYDNSKIIIEDNGYGMNQDIIENHFLNPATPEKKIRKAKKRTTDKNRVIQGEKGIGRFAILKLGRKIDIITRRKNETKEFLVEYDFTSYDDEFLTKDSKEKELFIDDIFVKITTREPIRIVEGEVEFGIIKKKRLCQGTIIEISDLKGSWSENKVKYVYNDLVKLQSIFSLKSKPQKNINSENNKFEIRIYKDRELERFHEEYVEKLHTLMEQKAIFKVEEGLFNACLNEYTFLLNGIAQKINFDDPFLKGLSVYKKVFGVKGEKLKNRQVECGSFSFDFYIFDFSSDAPPKYKLDKDDKDIIKEHRTYLYRDGIRVYPYGEPDDDWLRIDMYRGTISAGHFLSNDQVVGVINITQEKNPKLKDKTNREGLIDEGNATDDFIGVIQILLAFLRQKPYARYRTDLQTKENFDKNNKEVVEKQFDELKKELKDNKNAINIIEKVEKNYKAEKKFLITRAETTEVLAGVGLSVETASHDIMGIMGKVFANIDGLISDLISKDTIDKEALMEELKSIRGGMGFVEAQLKDIQLLFRSSKQRRKLIRVSEIIAKVERIYKRELEKEKISFTINRIGSPLTVKTTDAVLLQLLLNLIDNSVYWLKQVDKENKKIEILLNGIDGQMIFSDNGPGILEEDEPYIFEPFYSGKGEEGRGLGLYIARQLLERSDFRIDLASIKAEKLSSGANFVIDFFTEEKNEY